MRYTVDLARAGLQLPHKLAQGRLASDVQGWLRIEFLGAAGRTGLLNTLADGPRTQSELASLLGVSDLPLLRALLDLGVGLGELERTSGRFRLRGSRAKALADPSLDGMRGFLEELVGYDADVYRELVGRLRGEPAGDYLPAFGEVVARGSRVAEPLLSSLVGDVVRHVDPGRVLDVGCGTGIYLRHLADASTRVSGVGIDIQPDVVDLARRNLVAWNIADRFRVEVADVGKLPPELAGPWDLIFLFQNIYYWPAEERTALLSRLRQLAPRGSVVVATVVAGTGNAAAAHFDVVLQSTLGSYPLPTASELLQALKAAGYGRVSERRLAIGQPFRAFIAR